MRVDNHNQVKIKLVWENSKIMFKVGKNKPSDYCFNWVTKLTANYTVEPHYKEVGYNKTLL